MNDGLALFAQESFLFLSRLEGSVMPKAFQIQLDPTERIRIGLVGKGSLLCLMRVNLSEDALVRNEEQLRASMNLLFERQSKYNRVDIQRFFANCARGLF